jgi:hypothetical protein
LHYFAIFALPLLWLVSSFVPLGGAVIPGAA